MRRSVWAPAVVGTVAAGLLAPSLIRYYRDRAASDQEWRETTVTRIPRPGSVESSAVLPLIDWYTDDDSLAGEPGVSYLVRAGDLTVLFDVGYNPGMLSPSPLVRNMQALGVSRDEVDCVFISHPHVDHTGGLKAKRSGGFALTPDDPDPLAIPAFVPCAMTHSSADVRVVDGPLQIAPGVFSIGPITRSLWLLGLTPEQALAVNVEGKGIVLIIGCGHQTLERAVQRTEALFDEPLYGVIGGLHFPVTASRMDYGVQQILGTGKPPWRRIGREDVRRTVEFLVDKRPQLVGISAHDSCDWTLGEFKTAFGDRYRDVVVGREIIV